MRANSNWIRNAASLLAVLLLTGCTRAPQPAASGTVELAAGGTVGQTFVAEFDGLAGIEIYLIPGDPSAEGIALTLSGAPGGQAVVHEVAVSVAGDASPGWVRFPLEPRPDSASHSYYLSLRLTGAGSLRVGSAPFESYRDGSLYRGGEPASGQLAFRLVYHPGWAALGLAGEAGWGLLVLAAFALVFVLPGWAICSALWAGWAARDGLEKLAVSAAAGLALQPVLFLWTHLPGWQWGRWYALAPALAGLVWLARHWRTSPPRIRFSRSLIGNPQFLIVPALLLSRLLPLRTLIAPLWGDGYQHTLITQLLLDNGGLFQSWQPYAPLATFTYHFGFHAGSAALAWATGMSAIEAALWHGQLLNVLAVCALYPLANKLAGGNQWAGLAAVAVAGLFSPMPAFYTNWGRYTQLAGQALLPVWMLAAWELFGDGKRNVRLAALSGLLLGGLALSHFRVLIFAVLFAAAYWLVNVRREGLRAALGRTFAAGIGGAGLFLPWFWNVFGGQVMTIIGTQLATPPSAVPEAAEVYNQFGDLGAYLPGWVWGLAGGALAWGLARRARGLAAVGAWCGLALLASNPGWLGLPGTGVLNNFTVLIAAYIPAGLLIGWLAGRIDLRIAIIRQGKLVMRLAGTAAAGLALWGAATQAGIVTPAGHALVTRPDVQAAQWMRANLPEEAVILVNAFPAGGGWTAAGSDAGWWLPLLAGRSVTLPPFIYISETAEQADYRERVAALAVALAAGVTRPDTLALLRAEGVTHVYIGQLQGRVNYAGPALDAAAMLASPDFELLYHEDGAWVFGFDD